MNELYYTIVYNSFLEEIERLKSILNEEDIEELKCLDINSLDIFIWSKYNNYDTIVFFLFKFYYIIQIDDKSKVINLFTHLLHNFDGIFNITNFKYLRIFYIIINNKFNYSIYTTFKYAIDWICFNDLYILFSDSSKYEEYIEYIQILFFYNFLFVFNAHFFLLSFSVLV